MSDIELHRGTAFLSSQDLNRLARQQELSVVIAKASIFDQICQVVELSEEREAELVQTFLQRHSITSDLELEDYLKLRGWQEEDLIYVATKSEKLRKFQEKTFSQEVELSYLGRKIDIDIVDYTLLSVEDSDEAFELHQRLQENEATPEELKPISRIRQTSSLQSGFYGPQPISSSHSSLIPMLRVGLAGQLWPPFFKDGLWIITKLNHRNGVPLDDELYSELLDDLFERWLNERISNLITGQKSSELPILFKESQKDTQESETSGKNSSDITDHEVCQDDSIPKSNRPNENEKNPPLNTTATAGTDADQTVSNQCERATESKSQKQPEDPVLEWQIRFRAECDQSNSREKIVTFKEIYSILLELFPKPQDIQPKLQVFKDVLWIRHSGGLFNGKTGLVIPGTYLSRFPRQRQHPHLDRTWSELIRPIHAYPKIDESIFLPFANGRNFGHFATETIAYLWPYLTELSTTIHHQKPVLLSECEADAPFAYAINKALDQCDGIALYNENLPPALHLGTVYVPEPTLSLQTFVAEQHTETAKTMGDIIVSQQYENEQMPEGITEKVYISRSALSEQTRKINQEVELEIELSKRGWFIFHPQQYTLKAQIFVYRQASAIAGFEGSALHATSFIGKVHYSKTLIFLGDLPSVDYFLQFQAQEFDGMFIQCTELVENDDSPLHLRNRKLLIKPENLALSIDNYENYQIISSKASPNHSGSPSVDLNPTRSSG